MARKRLDAPTTGAGDGGILSQLPTVADLEQRLASLTSEAARVERLLGCIGTMNGTDAADMPNAWAEEV